MEYTDHSRKDEKKHTASSTNSVHQNYKPLQAIGSGTFGVVYQARCLENNEIVAIKKVLQDKRYKNRELQILKILNHNNIIKMKTYFYTTSKQDESYLNVVMDYIPLTLSKYIKSYKNGDVPDMYVKLYAFQMLRSINYIHSIGICHRDIKPQNILVDNDGNILKLCDFGSAKKLVKNESNVAYICSRYYRAPELIFGASDYTNAIDVWSIGCVIAEMKLGEPLFAGETSIDQIIEIIKVLGTPTKRQIKQMNSDYNNYTFPIIRCYTYEDVFKGKNVSYDFIDLLKKLLVYEPDKRIKPLEAMLHPFFNELKDKHSTFPDGSGISSDIFEFSEAEISVDIEGYIKQIIPFWYKNVLFREKL
jgi:glycogen synthase kinase 3 beta